MVLLMEGIDRLRSRRARSQLRMQQMREEAREKFRAEIREEVRQDVDDIVRERLAELGIASDTFPDLRRTAAEPRPTNGAPLAGHGSAGLTEENIRSVVRECLLQLGIKPGQAP